MGRAAERIKSRGVWIGIAREPLNRANPRRFEPGSDIARKVELGMTSAACCKKPVIAGIFGAKAVNKGPIDFIAGLRNARANRGNDPVALCSQCCHRSDRAVGHPGHCPFPAGVRGADDPGSAIGQQDRRAIGGDHAQHQPGPVGDDGVGVRTLVIGPGSG